MVATFDGVIANFTDSYAELLTKRTGIVFPKNSSSWPKEWYWDRAAGVQKDDEKFVWGQIMDSNFWLDLSPLPGAEETLQQLSAKRFAGDQIYFITTRPGLKAKLLTEYWLTNWGFPNATVIIAGSEKAKGQLASALKLDVFIDDKPENCEQVAREADSNCRIFLVDAPYNRQFDETCLVITRVCSAMEALTFKLEPLDVAA